MAKRPRKLHYDRSVARRHSADVLLCYAEKEAVRQANEQPHLGGHGQRPVEWREKSDAYDGCDRRQDKVPDVSSASMANKRAGPSSTVLKVLAK